MVTERELNEALNTRRKMRDAGGGRGGRGGGGDDGFGGGDMGRDRRLLLGLLDDAAVDLAVFRDAVNSEASFRFDDEIDRDWLEMGEVAGDLIDEDVLPKLNAIRLDIETSYPLRHAALFAHGLTGDALLFKAKAAKKRRLQIFPHFPTPSDLARFFEQAKDNFDLIAKILGSLEEALKEIPGMKAVIEAIDELLSIFGFWADDIAKRHKRSGGLISEFDPEWG